MNKCRECGAESIEETNFCTNCGISNENQPTVELNPQSDIEDNDEKRSEKHIKKKSQLGKIIGVLKMDSQVIDQIGREDDGNTGTIVLMINFLILSVIHLYAVFTYSNVYKVYSVTGTVIEIFLTDFGLGYLFVGMIARGSYFSGELKLENIEEMRRIMPYLYVAYVIQGLAYVVGTLYLVLQDIWQLSILYTLYLTIKVIIHTLKSTTSTAIINVVVAYAVKLIVIMIMETFLEDYLGGSYVII